MIETFFYAFHAIAPIVVLLLLGYYIGQKNCFDRHTLKQLSTFSFRFTMCALMFRNVYELPSIHSLEPNVTILVITSLIFITLAGFILASPNSGTGMGLLFRQVFEVIMPYSVWYWQKTYVVSREFQRQWDSRPAVFFITISPRYSA